MSLNNILQAPIFIKSIGNIYPIKIVNWDNFESHLNILMLSKQHIPVTGDEDIPLLHRIVIGFQDDKVNESLCSIFNLLTRTDSFQLKLNSKTYYFENELNHVIDADNYEEIRNVALHQNLLFEPKIYKDKLMQIWAEKVLKERQKNAANITLEDMITTVASLSGKHYWDLGEYSIYQLKSEFLRWQRIKQYDTTSILYANPYAASEVKLEHFAEFLNMYEDPYKDLFKSKDSLKNINKALG
jgi:hypothetical protein